MAVNKQKTVFISLKKKKSINELFDRSLSRSRTILLHSDLFIIRAVKQSEQSFFPLFILITVPKKVAIAVKRNYYKRQVRASLYCILKQFYEENPHPKQPGLNIGIIMKQAVVNTKYDEIYLALKVQLQKMMRINNN